MFINNDAVFGVENSRLLGQELEPGVVITDGEIITEQSFFLDAEDEVEVEAINRAVEICSHFGLYCELGG